MVPLTLSAEIDLSVVASKGYVEFFRIHSTLIDQEYVMVSLDGISCEITFKGLFRAFLIDRNKNVDS